MDDRSKFVLEVQRDAKDFWSLLGVITPRVWGWWRPFLNCGLLFGVALVSGVAVGRWMLGEGQDPEAGILSPADVVPVIAIVSGGLAVFLPLISNALIKPQLVSPNGAFLDPVTITIDEQGIQQEASSWKATNQWSSIFQILRARTGFILLTDHADGIFLPYRSIEDRDALLAFVNERISKSGNGA